ncbi:MAG: glucose 1-dehydrogenase [Microthrixaceae bacterium]
MTGDPVANDVRSPGDLNQPVGPEAGVNRVPVDLSRVFDLKDRVAIVTGASSGLGERFARVLAAAGAQVVVAARRVDRLNALAAEIGAVAIECDVTVTEDLERLVSTTIDRFGHIDILVNNAGVSPSGRAEEEPLEQVEWVMSVNAVALFHLSQLVGRHMIDRGAGSIVNIASILGLVASSPIKQASYCASKGAVVNLTRELGAQWARKGVRVNAIAPGWFPSEMTEDMIGDERSEAFIFDNCPMGRFGRNDELDGALLFLAGDASTYCTGQILAIDGGWTAR